MSGRGLTPPRHTQDRAAAAAADASAALAAAGANTTAAAEALALAQNALPAAGGVVTGLVHHVQLQAAIGPDLPSTGTATLDFEGPMLVSTAPLTGAVTFAATNVGAGRTVTVRVVNGATERALTFPAAWCIASKPDNIAANAVGVLTLTAFGATDADVVGAWVAVPP